MRTLFFNIPSDGHINPSLPVIRELVKRGEEVYYFNHEEKRPEIERTGATFVPYRIGNQFHELLGMAQSGNFARNALQLLNIMEHLLPDILATARDLQPHYLMFDSLASWGMLASRILDLPSVALTTTFVINKNVRPEISPVELMRLLVQFAGVMPAYTQMARRIQQQYGVKLFGLDQALMSHGDLNIVFTSKEFQPSAEKLPNTYRFVGASIQPRPHDETFPFDQLATDKPIVYISLGTINNQNLAFYHQCFEAFASFDVQFVLSIGKQTPIELLGRAPSNFLVRNFVPQLEILERSSAFVTHGGMNSVHESMVFGVPMLVIPQQAEQGGVARKVQRENAGIFLPNPTATTLAETLERLLTNGTFRLNATRLGDSLRQAGGYSKATDEILLFTETKHK